MTATAYTWNIPTGLVVADTADTLAQVQGEFQNVFGADLIVTPDTPQGALITAETIARNNFIQNNAAIANQINPNYAGGVFLDAILALTGVQRTPATPTVVTGVTITGVAGTIIPAGAQAQTSAGNLFQLQNTITIPSGGSTTGTFQSVALGSIPCAVNSLTQVVSAVVGWETVTNPSAGTVGSTTQSDQAARAFRQNTLFFQSKSLANSAVSALYNVPGVQSLTFLENVAATTATISGITLVPHSVYACVNGGVSSAIGAALLENKSSGAAWNGNTTATVIEPASMQAYTVLFDRPSTVQVYVQVSVHNCSVATATQAIVDFANGVIPGFNGFVVGYTVSPFELAGAIMAENPGAQVTSLTLSSTGTSGSFGPTSIPVAVNQIAATQASQIQVTVV